MGSAAKLLPERIGSAAKLLLERMGSATKLLLGRIGSATKLLLGRMGFTQNVLLWCSLLGEPFCARYPARLCFSIAPIPAASVKNRRGPGGLGNQKAMTMSKRGMQWVTSVFCLLAVCLSGGCQGRREASKLAEEHSFAELRTVKGSLLVAPPEQAQRRPYPRERLSEGTSVLVPVGGLAWMRRDGGATWLISGPAKFDVHVAAVEMMEGRAFVDSETGDPVSVRTPHGSLELSDARVSLEVGKGEVTTAYVLRGSARAGNSERATSGEMLTLTGRGKAERHAVTSWQDWTGGLGTADPAADPAPFGFGTVGARKPGSAGKPRFSLVIERMDVKVTIDQDFALTEVDQTFVNPSSDTVEGLFKFRTPPAAVLQRFGVDRDGELVWGRVKESAEALTQYQSNVYEGSQEDPALLTWQGAGAYGARLYPIHAGMKRRVVTRYAEWLSRQGPKGERRLYVYPMAAEGAKGSWPRIEELTITLDLSKAGAQSVRAGMGGQRDGKKIVVKEFDFVPHADLAVELFDAGGGALMAYRAGHDLPPEEAPASGGDEFAQTVSDGEVDYIAIPLRAPASAFTETAGLDLAVVVDTSAATEPSALALARSIASSLLTHLGPEDRAALWAGDASLRPVAEGSGSLVTLDASKKKAWLAGLARVERGGASDIGALLTEAAAKLDPKRRGAVVYVGDGAPSVGELLPKALGERLSRLPVGMRILAAAVGSQPNLALLETVVRGAPVEQIFDAHGAARSSLRLLQAAGRPLWLAAKLDLGPNVERVLPKLLPPIAADETVMVVGRVTGEVPKEFKLTSSGGVSSSRLLVRRLKDGGDLRRRWGGERLTELIDEGAGRASVVDIARRFGLVSPFTSLYVPTRRESEQEAEHPEVAFDKRQGKLKRWKPWAGGGLGLGVPPFGLPQDEQVAEASADEKEGGSGTRARGEEGSMGMSLQVPKKRYAVRGPQKLAEPRMARQAAAREVREFGLISLLSTEASSPPSAPRGDVNKSRPTARLPSRPLGNGTQERNAVLSEEAGSKPTAGNAWGEGIADVEGASGLGLEGIGEGGGGEVKGIGLGAVGTLGHGSIEVASGKVVKAARSRQLPVGEPQPRTDSQPIGGVGHVRAPCGPGADLPLSERLVLWRERLAVGRSVNVALKVYRSALRDCEASDWRERSALLVQIVDNLGTVTDRVALWRSLLAVSPAAADAVYRFLLLRVQTSQDLKDLHDALGFERIEAEILEALLKKGRSATERLALLRGAAEKFSDDTELALLVLDAYEDAGDDAGGRAWARKLRRRVDATARLRTNVGEYYLRLAAGATDLGAQRDAEEARRTFGELVEFAPEDPLARRRLGDLLSAHGWFAEAMRQYETLAALTPDDPSVALLLAAASQGTGKVEQAVRWTQKAAATGSPDGASEVSVAARALASVYLCWARQQSARVGRTQEVARLRARAVRLAASNEDSGMRAVLSWSHPELRPSLWSNAQGSMMPAADNLPLYGVAQVFVPGSRIPRFEVRLDREDAARAARLGVKATLTVVIGEGSASEKIARADVGFRGSGGAPREKVELSYLGGALVVQGAP